MFRHTLCLLICLTQTLMACTAAPEAPPPEPTATEMLVVAEFVTPKATSTATPAPHTPTPTTTPTPDPLASLSHRPANINPLTGLPVDDPTTLQRRPLMVRVGNDIEARPQMGLNQADIVYEELTEWWITRFSAIFLTHDPETISPIRSARLVNLQLAPQYQAALAHSGGSDPVRWEIEQSGLINLDEFFTPQPYFYRPNEGWQTRLAVNALNAREYLQTEGLEQAVEQRGFLFSDPLSDSLTLETDGEPASAVTIPYPPNTSQARWQYDAASQQYQRSTIGLPLMDGQGDPIRAANVIIYFAEHAETDIVEDSTGATSIRIIVNGRGPAWLLRDGRLLKGTWQTEGDQTPLYQFEDGTLMPLKPGNSWVQLVPLDYEIAVEP